MATLDEVGAFLASACSMTLATDVFIGQYPSSPDLTIALFEYPGMKPITFFGSSAIAVEYPRVQVTVRGEVDDYETPRAIAETAYRAMAAQGHGTLSGTRYIALEPLQSPFLIRKDEKGRPVIGFNAQITKELSA